ncbi:YqiA/YcfP family alpha/beta fold hydrolase [uncultured Umboniibacter sp.]|uniref:YqiA/YcfP family alpha/beta fold hydrolase n=1 Tax=uncultured Umboniibacter sp. TaxID=1798917 RepID=UPI002611D7D6|nr:YqiA/YcfP family alpha/beta fold hydrolase [uncultured Umboniibacter sp.]
MQVIFSHGKESGPWGSKIKALAEIAKTAGHDVESIDYSHTQDADERAAILGRYLPTVDDNVLLVGSSMGGYVSIRNANVPKVKGLFLLAPALYIPGYELQEYFYPHNIDIVHGWSDEVIPYQNSMKYAAGNNVNLHLIEGDHRLNSSLDTVSRLFEAFLAQWG